MKFANSQEELSHLQHLLDLERKEEERQFKIMLKEMSLEERIRRGYTWYPVILADAQYTTGKGQILTFRKTTPEASSGIFQAGQVVALYRDDAKGSAPEVTGVVARTSGDEVRVALPYDDLPEWLEEGKLGIDLYYDETTHKEMAQAVANARNAQNNRLSDLREILLGRGRPRFSPLPEGQVQIPELNPAQNRAVQMVLEAEDAALIHGPPGTGKTTTLTEAIRLTLKREKQVLVVAPSNMATDLIAEKLSEKGIRVLRLGHPVRVSEQIQELTLDVQTTRHPDYPQLKRMRADAKQLRKKAMKFKRNYVRGERQEQLAEVRDMMKQARDLERYILRDLLDDAQVIACTPVLVNADAIAKREFSTVFIDEAAQMLEPAAWIAIQKARRVIFAGDHCQLPPTVKCVDAEKQGLSETLFEKFHRRQIRLGETWTATLLDTQYRMHRHIMSYSNAQFYDNELVADRSVAERALVCKPDAETDVSKPVVEFIDTAGCSYNETLNPETRSLSNQGEAGVLLNHLKTLIAGLSEETLAETRIGVISPYKEQVYLLRKTLMQDKDLFDHREQLVVNTIDGFQGQECEVVYISLVRSNENGSIGFLSDVRRMNVAMTRAKLKLVVIGDSATISSHLFYDGFIDFVNTIDAYRSAWEFMAF